MTTAPFYPVTPQHPPFRVIVRLLWRGRIFKAQRDSHPEKKYPCWITYDKNFNQVYLPPRGRRAKEAWGDDPAGGWQPLDPSQWVMPLPAPFPNAQHDGKERFVNIRARRKAVDALVDAVATEKMPWWWDATAIAYQPKGEVSPDMAVGRMMRAAAVSGASGMQGQPKPQKDAMRDWGDITYEERLKKEAEEEAARAEQSAVRKERFVPTPADLRDWDTAMSWFAALNPPELRSKSHEPFSLNVEQQIIVWRATRRSWREIAKHLERSTRYVRDRYRDAMMGVWNVANGLPVHGYRTGVDHVGDLRERNRAHHNRSDSYG